MELQLVEIEKALDADKLKRLLEEVAASFCLSMIIFLALIVLT